MILLFPNADTFRLALSRSIVPDEVTIAPARVSFDEGGKIYLEPGGPLSRAAIKNLDKIGVKGSKRHATPEPEVVSCWPQVLPVVREPGSPATSAQAPVLFELSHADDLPTLAIEMLRLGNDRQSFRWFAAPGDDESKRVLLRVIGPPYYTLLRALDPSMAGTKGQVRAYLERAPRLWVEIGHTHPLAGQVRVADGQFVLLRSPREWVYVDETAYQDIYDITQFQLPAAPVAWSESKGTSKLTIPLRLAPGNAADVPELWVLRDNAFEQLDTLVRDSDERLTQRLMFAVATDAAGQQIVVLRTRPTKQPPPALPLDSAVGFKPYWKLPNLYVPVGQRLHPTLRRDTVRRLLADDADMVVWLYPRGHHQFTPESLPDAAFRPLEDWVEYVIESEQKPLAAWIEATVFDFEYFVCRDGTGPRPKPDKPERETKGKEEPEESRGRNSSQPSKSAGKGRGVTTKSAVGTDFTPIADEVKPPSEWKLRRQELEAKFLAAEGTLDSPDRTALWPELAAACAATGDKSEAAICWLNAMWDSEPIPPEWLRGWLRSELPTGEGLTAHEFDKLLGNPAPTGLEARTTVAAFLWLAGHSPVPSWLGSRLAAVQDYLQKHEQALPVRAVWLGAYRLSQLAGADVLGLARFRDRILQRLLDHGLSAEQDLPSFLRFAGLKDSDRLRVVRDRSWELHAAVQKWTQHIPVNQPYVDLLFAFALAKLGEASLALKLVEDARKVMEAPFPTSRNQQDDPKVTAAIVSNFLFKAFKYRIEQALKGKPHGGPLAPALKDELDEVLRRSAAGPANNPYKLAHYVISRMRDQSYVLEPHERLDPYAEWTKSTDPLKKELSELHGLTDPERLRDRIRKLYREWVQQRGDRDRDQAKLQVLHEALPLSTRVGEAFTVELLQLVPSALRLASSPGEPEPPDMPRKQGELLERGLFLAGHFDRGDLIKKLVEEFSALIRTKSEEVRFRLINVVAGQCLRSLKKLGMRDEIDRFLSRLHNDILQSSSTAELKKRYATRPEMWGAVLQTLLSLAGGWLTYGWTERAYPILDEVRNELLGNSTVRLAPKEYTELAQAYITALGHGPSETGLSRILEFFRNMDEKRITNTWTTAQYYSRFHLNLVESTIRAIISDEFALGPSGRRWLDEDEYLVRKRIHSDMRRHLEKSGL
jgi:hypothetical protein